MSIDDYRVRLERAILAALQVNLDLDEPGGLVTINVPTSTPEDTIDAIHNATAAVMPRWIRMRIRKLDVVTVEGGTVVETTGTAVEPGPPRLAPWGGGR